MPIRTMVINDSIGLLNEISRLLLPHRRIDLAAMMHDDDESWEEVNVLRPELVVTSLRLRMMSPLEKTRELRRISPTVCIIIIGADNRPELVDHCRHHGADCFIPRSRLRYDLWPAIERATNQARMGDPTGHGGDFARARVGSVPIQ